MKHKLLNKVAGKGRRQGDPDRYDGDDSNVTGRSRQREVNTSPSASLGVKCKPP